jgi:hypothetical protein
MLEHSNHRGRQRPALKKNIPAIRPARESTTTTGRIGRQLANSPLTAAVLREVTRHVPAVVQNTLWAKSAGRCEFRGHNKPLWKSSVTQESVNIADKAHIYSFSPIGSRGNVGIPDSLLNSSENLLLICGECHRKIDKSHDGGRYPVDFLRRMKIEHETRVERVTGIAPELKSHVLLYGAKIGQTDSPLNYRDAAEAMFPGRYPANDTAFELSTLNSSLVDCDADFFDSERRQLVRKFGQQIRERVATRDIEHLSVFGLAPQPLLILLGTLLGDIVPSDIYQRHREPPTWQWPERAETTRFRIRRPKSIAGKPALVLALSGNVSEDRIMSVLGGDASIYLITVAKPHNEVLKSPAQLSEFRTLARKSLNEIKLDHGQSTPLHVFSAAPVSVAVELGRVRMPKADMPWEIYDQNNLNGGFIRVLTIPTEDNNAQ